jgi:hypothetical protein
MPGKHFEKQVQQKLEELSILPSAPVWHEVEKQIKKRKERRGFAFRISLALLIALGGMWWWHGMETKKYPGMQAQISTNSHHAAATTKETIQKRKGHSMRNNADTAAVPAVKISASAGQVASYPVNASHADQSNTPLMKKPFAEKGIAGRGAGQPRNGITGRHNTFSYRHKEMGRFYQREANVKEIIRAREREEIAGMEEYDPASVSPAMVGGIDNRFQPPVEVTAPIPDISGGLPSLPRASNKTKKHPIEWGITVKAGTSANSNGFFSGLFAKSMADALNYYNNSAPSGSAGNPGTPAGKPSEVKNGFSFSAGLTARKKIGKQLYFFAGLRYTYYSTRVMVGQKIDSNTAVFQLYNGTQAISGYYSNSGTNLRPYTNRFQLVELPAGIEKQLGHASRFAVTAGLSVDYLFAANALHYDAQKNIYYKDNHLLNRVQAGADAGVRYSLLRRKTYEFQLGPGFRYGISHPFKKEVYGARHMVFAGMDARIIFHKK